MLYHLFDYLESNYTFPGERLYQYISFRSAMAIIFSLGISTIYGKKIINFLQKKQVGESVRDLGLHGQTEKAGTPTMGGSDNHHRNSNPGPVICQPHQYLRAVTDSSNALDGGYRFS